MYGDVQLVGYGHRRSSSVGHDDDPISGRGASQLGRGRRWPTAMLVPTSWSLASSSTASGSVSSRSRARRRRAVAVCVRTYSKQRLRCCSTSSKPLFGFGVLLTGDRRVAAVRHVGVASSSRRWPTRRAGSSSGRRRVGVVWDIVDARGRCGERLTVACRTRRRRRRPRYVPACAGRRRHRRHVHRPGRGRRPHRARCCRRRTIPAAAVADGRRRARRR